MADVIEICSSDDEIDPVAKINKKLIKGLTVTDNRRKIVKRSKVPSPKKRGKVMPTIVKTVSLASADNAPQPKPARAKKKIPLNLPSSITVKSVTKQRSPAKPQPNKVIFKTGRTPIVISKQIAELMTNTLKANSSLNARVQEFAPSVTVTKSRNASPVPQLGGSVTVKKVAEATQARTPGRSLLLPLTIPTKRKANDVPPAVHPPSAPKRRSVAAQKGKKDSVAMEKLKNNKNIVMKATSGQDSGKENTATSPKPSLSIITVVNLDDSDNESKENGLDPLVAGRNGIVGLADEVLEIDGDSRDAISIVSDNTDVSNSSGKLTGTRRRGRRKSNRSAENTPVAGKPNSKNSTLNKATGQPLNHITLNSRVDNDVEMVDDPYFIDTIGSDLTNNLTIASGMSEGECIGIDDNDIQIIEMRDEKSSRPSLPQMDIGAAFARSWTAPEKRRRSVAVKTTNARNSSGAPRKQTPKRISNTLVSSLKEPAKQGNIPIPSEEKPNIAENMIVDYKPVEIPVTSTCVVVPAGLTERIQRNDTEKAAAGAESATKQQTSSGNEFRYSNVYRRFIDLCLELDGSDDMRKIVEKKVKSYYRLVDERFVKLGIFEKLVLDNMESMKRTPEYKHLYIKNVVDELKAKRKMRFGDKSETIVVDGEDESKQTGKRWVSEKHIEKLEKALNKLHKAIKILEEKEVNFDDDDESVFLMTERYKARAVRVYEKLCSLRGLRASQQNPAVPGLRRGDIGNSPGVAALTTWLIKGGFYAFPDYRDVLECVKTDVKKLKLLWSEGKIEDEAEKLFTNCGLKLKRARQADAWAGAHSVISFKPDPANEDPDLREKLVANAEMYKSREEEIINHFAEQQTALRLEPLPVDDRGQLEEERRGASETSVAPPVGLKREGDAAASDETDAAPTSPQTPVGLASALDAHHGESQELLRVVGYDYIPLNMV